MSYHDNLSPELHLPHDYYKYSFKCFRFVELKTNVLMSIKLNQVYINKVFPLLFLYSCHKYSIAKQFPLLHLQ